MGMTLAKSIGLDFIGANPLAEEPRHGSEWLLLLTHLDCWKTKRSFKCNRS